MFNFLKKKLKGAISSISSKVEEEAEVVKEKAPEVKIEPKKEVIKKEEKGILSKIRLC